jgi:hypothetical protein
MKVKAPKHFSRPSLDVKKTASIKGSLVKRSEKEHRQELTGGNTKVKLSMNLNALGDRRGMNMVENPPDSETMRKRRLMRKIWNPRMPSLNCSNCQMSAQCEQFKAGYVCAFEPFLQSHTIDSEEDLMFYAKEMLQEGIKRAQLTIIFEKMAGGKPSLETTESLAYLFDQLVRLHERMSDMNKVSIEVESKDSSIVHRLFGNIETLVNNTRDAKEKPIDVITVSGETKLQERDMLQLPERTSHTVNEDLVRDLAFLRETPQEQKKALAPSQPIVEELI